LKKVAIIGSAGIPPRYGGFETLVQNLVTALQKEFMFFVYCSRRLYSKRERPAHQYDARLIYLPVNPNGPQSIIYDLMSLIHAARKVDVLLILGVSGCLFLPLVKLFSSGKIITHIDGLEWKRKKWNPLVKLFLKLSEAMAIKYSDEIVADNEAIKSYIMNKYNIEPRLIEYGGEHAVILPAAKDIREGYITDRRKYALAVSRIEPENNIHVILSAFSEMPSSNIVIVGNWKNSRYGKGLRKKYADYTNISMYNPVYDQDTINTLRKGCGIYIHGYSAGGTNPSLVEAMYAGKPVIAYDIVFNRVTTMNRAFYFKSKDDLVLLLNNLTVRQLDEKGKDLKEVAFRKYRWKAVTEKYAGLFNQR
jgi:glycosyltransferase involved in cell wall biosynthesis